MNCITYARVSTERQAERELSLPAQQQAMREYAGRQGWAVVEEFVEAGASGRTINRPVLQDLLARCRGTARVDVVLVHKIDRLARSVFDHATIKTVLKQRGVRLASVVENVDDSVSGQLVENIMASIAEFYSANLGEETRKGMRAMVEKGGWPHKVPRGYLVSRDERGRPCVVVDPAVAAQVRKAFDLYATGTYSLKQLARVMAEQGLVTRSGKALPVSNLRKALDNPFYAGRLRWHGVEYSGSHQAIVPADTYSRVQSTLRERFKRPGEKGSLRFLLRGVATCVACGAVMTAERHGRWAYYRCVRNTRDRRLCGARFSNAADAEAALAALYQKLNLSSALHEMLSAAGQRQIEQRVGLSRKGLAGLRRRQASLYDQEARLSAAYAEGEGSPEAYRAVLAKFRHDHIGLDRAIANAQLKPQPLLDRLARVLDVARTLSDLNRRLALRDRQRLLRLVFRSVVLKAGRIARYELHAPFDGLLEEATDPEQPGAPGIAGDLEDVARRATIESILEVDSSMCDFAINIQSSAA